MKFQYEKVIVPVVSGRLVFAAIGLDHGHIIAMCKNLEVHGGYLKWIYDENINKAKMLKKQFPNAKICSSAQEILCDKEVKLIISTIVPNKRAELGIEVLKAGKNYFTDKIPMTSLDQIEAVKKVLETTDKHFFVSFSKRMNNEAAFYATELIKAGAIGRVLQILQVETHTHVANSSKAEWFYDEKMNGGLLGDFGCHLIEQHLHFSGCEDTKLISSRLSNIKNDKYPNFSDYADMSLLSANGVSGQIRVDWLAPNWINGWGEDRTTIFGSEGYIELGKFYDEDGNENDMHILNGEGEYFVKVAGKIGLPFYKDLVLDCIYDTDNSIKFSHIEAVVKLAIEAQEKAIRIK